MTESLKGRVIDRLPKHLRPLVLLKEFHTSTETLVFVSSRPSLTKASRASWTIASRPDLTLQPIQRSRRQVSLSFSVLRRNEVLFDEAPRDNADRDRPDLRPNFFDSDEFGDGDEVAEFASFRTTFVRSSRPKNSG